MVLTVSFVLSPVTGLVCHRRLRTNVLSKPGRADLTSANLTPASGRQDHTTSPYATTSLVRVLCDRSRIQRTRPAIPSRAKRCRVHRTPPRVRDDHDTPLWWGGMTRVCRDDLPDGASEIFLPRGLDDPNQLEKSQQISLHARGTWSAHIASIERSSRRLLVRTWPWRPDMHLHSREFPMALIHLRGSASACGGTGRVLNDGVQKVLQSRQIL